MKLAAWIILLGLSSPALAYNTIYYGVAISDDDFQIGTSFSLDSEEDAQAKAIEKCEEAGNDPCPRVHSVTEGCIAYAVPWDKNIPYRRWSIGVTTTCDAATRWDFLLMLCKSKNKNAECEITFEICPSYPPRPHCAWKNGMGKRR